MNISGASVSSIAKCRVGAGPEVIFGLAQGDGGYTVCTSIPGKEWLESTTLPGTFKYRWQAYRSFGELFGPVVTRWYSPVAKRVCVGGVL